MFGKKGDADAMKPILFMVGGLLAGGLVFFAALNLAADIASSTPEEVVAKDLAYTIMTISSAPTGSFSAKYLPNTEKYVISIKQDNTVEVSGEDVRSSGFYPMRNVKVLTAVIEKQLSLPIVMSKGVLKFAEEDENESNADTCAGMPSYFASNTKVYIYSSIRQPEIDAIIKSIKLMVSTSSEAGFVVTDSPILADVIVSLSLGADDVLVTDYYDDGSNNRNFEKIACYAQLELKDFGDNYFTGVKHEKTSDPKSVNIILGSQTRFLQLAASDSRTVSDLAQRLTRAIKRGISGG